MEKELKLQEMAIRNGKQIRVLYLLSNITNTNEYSNATRQKKIKERN